MAKMTNDTVVYFLYSDEMMKERNQILSKQNKMFQAGTVVVNGVAKQYTYMNTKDSIPRFIDAKVVASGRKEDFKYTEPATILKRGTSI